MIDIAGFAASIKGGWIVIAEIEIVAWGKS
jgi:hypothetical protein